MSEHPYQTFLSDALPATTAHRAWAPGDAPLPAAERGHRARFGVYFYSEREE